MGAKSKKKRRKAKGDPLASVLAPAAPTAAGAAAPAGLTVLEAIARRRTHKRFTARPVLRAEIETMLAAAVLAPNHKLTEPWRFVVLGPAAARAYGELRAVAKVGPAEPGEEEKAAARRARIVEEVLAVPALIALLMHQDEDEFRREEDHAAVWMAAQNMLLAGTALGLGTRIATGRLFGSDALRALVQAKRRERVLGMIHVGEPAEARPLKERTPAAALTTWLD